MNNCGCNNNRIITPDCDMSRWEVQCSSYIEDADNYYTKKEVDDLIESGVTPDLSDYYTKEETDSAITSAITAVEAEIPTVPTSNTAFTNDAGYITGVDLSNYATLGDVQSVQNGLTAHTADTNIHLTQGEVRYMIYQDVSGYTDSSDFSAHTADTSIHLTSGDVQNQISGKTDNTDFSAHTADTSIHLTSGDVQNAISGKADYSDIKTYSAGNGIAISTANTISLDVPVYKGSGDTNVSICIENGNLQGQNKINSTFGAGIGWGLITQNTGESSIGSYNKSSTDNVQTYGSSGKTCFTIGNGTSNGHRHNALEIRENGDIYIADTSASGQGYEKPMIKLQDNIGGGSGTTYTAGDGIDITNNVISTTTKFWCGTQLEYDQIQTKDPNTVYMIHN